MFGGDDMNPLFLIPMDNLRVPYNPNAVPPVQLDVHVNSNAGMMNVIGNNNVSSVNLPMKLGSGAPIVSQQQKFPVTFFDGIGQDEGREPRSVLKQNPVSTGLKLSYGEEEHNSCISSAGESANANLSSILSCRENFQTELVRQNGELDQFIRMQEEYLRKGITELQYRHTVSLLNALEKEVDGRIREKDAEIENLNRRNRELVEKIRQIAIEGQSWQYKAKQNESLVNALRSNINQVFLQGAALVKEGEGENVVDDAVSSCSPNHLDHLPNLQIPASVSTKQPVNCKACGCREVSVLWLPCRHLCLCTECEAFIDICPVCSVQKAGTLQVYMS